MGPREGRIVGCGVGTLGLHEGAYTVFMAFTWSPDTIWLLLQKAWWFLVVLGVLVAFHELGVCSFV